jgi:hypothetical protein
MPRAVAEGKWWNTTIHGKPMKRRRSGKEKLELLDKAAQEGGVRGFIGKGSQLILNETRTGRFVRRIVERQK